MPQDKIRFLGGTLTNEQAQDLVSKQGMSALRCFVFVGRSNVGKSSLLNTLTKSSIARVSQTPGRTREMNFFYWKGGPATSTKISSKRDALLVDLPGYGYAQGAQDLKKKWSAEITQWLKMQNHRSLLGGVLVLVDSRIGFMPQDQEMLEFLKAESVPYLVVFTKFDKWKSRNQQNNAKRQLLSFAEKLDVSQTFFCTTKEPNGVLELEKFIRSQL